MQGKSTVKYVIFAVVTVLAVILATMSPFDGLERSGMIFIGLFIWWVVMQALNLIAGWMVTMITLLLFVVTGCDTFTSVFSAFGGTVVWLVIGAFGIAAALIKCGLFKRISLNIMKLFPGSYVGQLIGVTLASLVISPCMPGGFAKDAIIFPMTNSVVDGFGFKPHSKGAVGIYVMPTVVVNFIGAMLFMSGSTYAMYCTSAANTTVSWVGWFKLVWPWGVAMIVLYLLYCILFLNPGRKGGAATLSKESLEQELKDLGPMSGDEKYALVVLILTVFLWITEGSLHDLPTCVPALLALALLYIKGIFTDKDVATKIPWTLIAYIGGITAVLTTMSVTGVTSWVAAVITPMLSGVASSVILVIIITVLITTLLRFAVISTPTLAAIMAVVFGAVGLNPLMVAFCAVSAGGGTFILNFQNTQIMSVIGLTEGRLEHKDLVPAAWLWVVFNLISLIVCIPWWSAIGMIV